MMEKEVASYRKYKSDIIFMLAVSGLWPDYKRYPKAVKHLLTCLAVFAEFSVTFGIINFCVENRNNIMILTRCTGLIISYSSTCLKVLILLVNRKNIAKLNRSLSNQFEKDLEKEENRPHLLAHRHSFHRFFRLHYYYTAAIGFLLAIGPLLALRHGKRLTIYPQRVPFDYQKGGIAHWGTYGFELVVLYFGWTNTVGPDSVFGFYVFHMVGELRLLSSRFRNLKSGKNYKRQLKNCIDRHVLLIESKHVLERIFGFLSVWLAVTCAIVICTIIFQISQMEHLTPVRVMLSIVYCVVKFLQAYTYAWFGHVINLESERCIDSIYEADWAGDGDLQFMNDALIILSQNPMHFEAMSIMIVRMDMFSKIMNTSVSYFFLLKALDENLEKT